MNLALPGAMMWAFLGIPILIFYILKIRMKRVPVSTVMFWEQIFQDKQPRSIWQTLRHLLSLLLQLIFLALLVFALAKPFFDWEVREQRRLILVLDNSASMRATDIEPTRFDAAKLEADRLIKSMKVRDEMAVIAAGNQPRVVCGLTSHQKTLRNAVETITTGDGPTRVTEAVELARRLLADHAKGQVIILSDGCFPESKDLARHDDVIWSAIGETKADNVGITRFQVRRSLLDPIGYELLVEVSNFSDEPAECKLDLELGTEIVDVIPIKIEPNDKWTQVYEKTSVVGGHLIASIDSKDALASDNSARAILPDRPRIPITLVTDGNLFLQRVLEANSLVDLTITDTPPTTTTANSITILHQKTPATIPSGRVLVVQPQKATDLWDVGEKIDNPIVAKQDEDSDLMKHVRLNNVIMPEALKLTPKVSDESQVKMLVESGTEDPLYFSIQRDGGNVLVLTVNIDRGDLPLRTAFPIMMSNALAWFADNKGELRPAVPTGTLVDVELPDALQSKPGATNSELVLSSPTGEDRRIPGGTATSIGPLDQSGIWSIHHPREQEGWSESQLEIACNLASQTESDVRIPDELKPKQTTLAAGFGGRPVWFILILLAWLLTGLEWWLYQRRWIS